MTKNEFIQECAMRNLQANLGKAVGISFAVTQSEIAARQLADKLNDTFDKKNDIKIDDVKKLLSLLVSRPMSVIEKQAIADEIKRCGGNKTKAAKNLGISARTLFRKIQNESKLA